MIANQDIEQQKVLGKTFDKEISDSRKMFGGKPAKDDRIDAMDRLIDAIDADD